MDAQKTIQDYLKDNGVTLSYISGKTGMSYELLRRSIVEHKRKLRADEWLAILKSLGIKVELKKEQENIPLI